MNLEVSYAKSSFQQLAFELFSFLGKRFPLLGKLLLPLLLQPFQLLGILPELRQLLGILPQL